MQKLTAAPGVTGCAPVRFAPTGWYHRRRRRSRGFIRAATGQYVNHEYVVGPKFFR